MDIIKFRDIIAIKNEIEDVEKFFVLHETSGYFIEIEAETYEGLKKLNEGKRNKLTKEEKTKLIELFSLYTTQLPLLKVNGDVDDPPYLLGGSINVSQACNFETKKTMQQIEMFSNFFLFITDRRALKWI